MADISPECPAEIVGIRSEIYRDGIHLPVREWERSPVYQDLFRKTGFKYCMGPWLFREAERKTTIAIHRGEKFEPFNRSDAATLRRLAPHFKSAIRMYRQLSHAGATADLDEALGWLAIGAVLLSAQGRVMVSNRAADAVIRRSDGLTVRNGRLHATQAAAQKTLGDAIASATGRFLAGGKDVLPIPRTSDRRPYVVFVSRVGHGNGSRDSKGTAAVVVFISDPDRRPVLPAATLTKLYGLTRAESDFALGLMSDETPETWARRREVSRHTVKAQLVSIFRKTGVRRQAELVRRLLVDLGGFGPIPGDGSLEKKKFIAENGTDRSGGR